MSIAVPNPTPAREVFARDTFRCSRCGLVLTARAPSLTPRHCPRCLARRVAVELERRAPRITR